MTPQVALDTLIKAARPDNERADISLDSEDTGTAVDYILVEEEPRPTAP